MPAPAIVVPKFIEPSELSIEAVELPASVIRRTAMTNIVIQTNSVNIQNSRRPDRPSISR